MPTKPLRTCSTPGCPNLTNGGRCDECKSKTGNGGWQDDRTRGTRTERGYDNTWLRLRKRKLIASPLCEECEKSGRLTAAEEVHHKQPFHGKHDPLRLDWENLESLCRACHGTKTARQSGPQGGG